MGVAYSSGLSKNGSLSEPDAVVPIMKVGLFPQAFRIENTDRNSTSPHMALLSPVVTQPHSWAMETGKFFKTS